MMIECVMTRGEKYPDRNSRNPETVFAVLKEIVFRDLGTINALFIIIFQLVRLLIWLVVKILRIRLSELQIES